MGPDELNHCSEQSSEKFELTKDSQSGHLVSSAYVSYSESIMSIWEKNIIM